MNLGEDNLRMIQFLKLPDSSLERIAMLDDMAKKVNETISKSIALLVLHLTFVSIVMLITCYARLTYLMRIGVAYTVTVLERIYVWYDDASDSFLRPWPPEIVEAHLPRAKEEEPRRRTTEVKRRFTGD